MIDKLKSIKEFKDLVKGYNKHKFRLRDPNGKTVTIYDDSYCFKLICNYIDIMDKPLELGMFVPCVDGLPLEKPTISERQSENFDYLYKFNIYKEAEKNVLFKGFEYEDGELFQGEDWFLVHEFTDVHKILDLLIHCDDIELTKAFKQLITK